MKKVMKLVLFCTFSAVLFNSQLGFAIGLKESIDIAFSKNPKTQANMERLKAQYLEVKALKKALMLPSINVSYTAERGNEANRLEGTRQKTRSSELQYSIGMNIFNGFADYYQIKARECSYKQQEAIYNSTNTLIQNTRGYIAGLVAKYYVDVVRYKANLDFNLKKLDYFKGIRPFATTDEEITRIENAIHAFENETQEIKTMLEISEANLKYVLNDELPADFEDLDTTIKNLVIPQTLEDAIASASKSSPEIISARYGLECQSLYQKSVLAEYRGVRIDVSAGRVRNTYVDAFNQSALSTNKVGITISKSFNLGMPIQNQAEASKVRAAALDLEGVTSDTKNDLNTNYKQLNGVITSLNNINSSFAQNIAKMDSLYAEIIAGKSKELIFFIELSNSAIDQWWNLDSKKMEIINMKFYIQRSVGSLFENIPGQ